MNNSISGHYFKTHENISKSLGLKIHQIRMSLYSGSANTMVFVSSVKREIEITVYHWPLHLNI